MLVLSNTIAERFDLKLIFLRTFNLLLMRDVLPALITIIIITHSATRLIHFSKHYRLLQQRSEHVVLESLFARLTAVILAAILLYFYILFFTYFAIYLYAALTQKAFFTTYLNILLQDLKLSDFIIAIFKTTLFAFAISLISSLYYLKFENKQISLSQCASNIITRGIFWLILLNIFVELLTIQMGY